MTTEETADLRPLWQGVLDALTVQHPDPATTVTLNLLGEDPYLQLHVMLDNVASTDNQHKRISGFNVGVVQLRYWPGKRLAAMWLAAAWAGYLQHEALELVRFKDVLAGGGIGPLHPHAALRSVPAHHERSHDRGVRNGWPQALSRESLMSALAVVMPFEAARTLVERDA